MPDNPSPSRSGRLTVTRSILLLVLAALALALTWYDGVARALGAGMVDFNILYGGTRLFLEGSNPYFSAPLQEILGPSVRNVLGLQMTLPGTFAVLAPVGLLEHETASTVWLLVNLASVVVTLYLVLELTALRPTSWHGLLLVVLCLLLGPFRMGIRQGQLDSVVLCFVLLSLVLLWNGRSRVASGVLLAVGIVLKPTSAGLFAIYLYLRGQVKAALVSLVLSGAVIVLCAGLLVLRAPEWWSELSAILASPEVDFNRVNDDNPRPELLTHLHAGLFAAFGSVSWARIAAFALCLTVLFRTLFSTPSDPRDDRRETCLRELSIVALVGLLIVYHRFYSGVFLVLPLAWAVYLTSRRRATLSAWLIMVMPLLTLVNTQAAYTAVVERGWVPMLTGSTWIEQVLLQFNYVWLQLLVLLVLFAEQLRRTRFAPESIARAFTDWLEPFRPKSSDGA